MRIKFRWFILPAILLGFAFVPLAKAACPCLTFFCQCCIDRCKIGFMKFSKDGCRKGGGHVGNVVFMVISEQGTRIWGAQEGFAAQALVRANYYRGLRATVNTIPLPGSPAWGNYIQALSAARAANSWGGFNSAYGYAFPSTRREWVYGGGRGRDGGGGYYKTVSVMSYNYTPEWAKVLQLNSSMSKDTLLVSPEKFNDQNYLYARDLLWRDSTRDRSTVTNVQDLSPLLRPDLDTLPTALSDFMFYGKTVPVATGIFLPDMTLSSVLSGRWVQAMNGESGLVTPRHPWLVLAPLGATFQNGSISVGLSGSPIGLDLSTGAMAKEFVSIVSTQATASQMLFTTLDPDGYQLQNVYLDFTQYRKRYATSGEPLPSFDFYVRMTNPNLYSWRNCPDSSMCLVIAVISIVAIVVAPYLAGLYVMGAVGAASATAIGTAATAAAAGTAGALTAVQAIGLVMVTSGFVASQIVQFALLSVVQITSSYCVTYLCNKQCTYGTISTSTSYYVRLVQQDSTGNVLGNIPNAFAPRELANDIVLNNVNVGSKLDLVQSGGRLSLASKHYKGPPFAPADISKYEFLLKGNLVDFGQSSIVENLGATSGATVEVLLNPPKVPADVLPGAIFGVDRRN
jgi:hypothetical protein